MSSLRTGWLFLIAVTGIATPSQAQTGMETAGHVLRRISYGPSPTALFQLLPLGGVSQETLIDQYVAQQLSASFVDPSPVIPGVQLLPNPPVHPTSGGGGIAWSIDNLARHNLALALYSKNQLRELMVGFWQQHFNTAWFSLKSYFDQQNLAGVSSAELATYFEYVQNEGFRSHALGTFRDLLEVSARGVAMTIYLDSVNNTAAAPNENYARELLELHTLGTDQAGVPNLYTEADIDEVARIFTGWSVAPDSSDIWGFQFNSSDHSSGVKYVFQETAEAFDTSQVVGEQEGSALLDHLAQSATTKDFICRKLFRFFFGAEPTSDADLQLLHAAVTAWDGPDPQLNPVGGDLSAVLKVFLESDKLRLAGEALDIVERPIEALTSTVRALGGQVQTFEELDFLYKALNDSLAQSLFRFPAPDGFPFESLEQISTSQWLNRIRVHEQIDALYDSSVDGNDPNQARVTYDLVALHALAGPFFGVDLASEESVVRWFFALLHQRDFFDLTPSSEISDAIAFAQGGPSASTYADLLSSDATAYLTRVSELLQYLTSIPRSFQK